MRIDGIGSTRFKAIVLHKYNIDHSINCTELMFTSFIQKKSSPITCTILPKTVDFILETHSDEGF